MAPTVISGYYGVKTVFYNRIHGDQLGPIILDYSVIAGNTMVSELLPDINDQYGVYIKPSDIIDAPIPPTTPGQPVNISLVFSETSIIFYSGTVIEIPSLDPSALLGDAMPQELGEAHPGSSSKAARDDHVHPMPTASDIPGLGNSATCDVGTSAGTVAAGDHTHSANAITGLATVAITGDYNDLENLPGSGGATGVYQEKLRDLIVTTGYSSVIEFNRQIVIVADPHELYIPGNPDDLGNTNTAKNGDWLVIKNNTASPTNIYWGNYLVKGVVPDNPMVLPPGQSISCIYSFNEKSFF